MYAEGKLRVSRWKEQKTGETRAKLQVSVTRLEILGRIGKRRGARRLRRQSADNAGTENAHLPAPEDPLPF